MTLGAELPAVSSTNERYLGKSKTIDRDLNKTIREKREQLVAIREEVENLIDYLEVLEARASDQTKPRTAHADVMKRSRVK